MAELKSIEHPTLKVPYEVLNKKFRIAQKTLDREINIILQSASTDLERGAGDGDVTTVGQMTNFLSGFVEKLHILKRKAEESIGEELAAGQVCKRRLDHLKLHCKAPTSTNFFENIQQPINEEEQISIAAENQWKKVRLNRLIVEHFLRLGYYSSAEVLADRCGIREISNVDIFQVIREVEKDLSNHNTSKCIAWCIDNKSKLRKINSNIEFKIRQQEFIELIKSEQRVAAVKHAQKFFPAFEQDQLEEIKKCMALLAFPVSTQLEPYKTMLDSKRWDDLLVDFRLENYRLFGIPIHSVLSCAVQTGLSALKTPQCYSKNSKNNNCPICELQINELAESLPFSHCAQSRLICRVTKLPLNENNQPVYLPNGHVVGEKALTEITRDGVVICPFTNDVWKDPKIEKVFVM